MNSNPKPWQKSSFSGANGNCLEISTDANGELQLRNSSALEAGVLPMSSGELDAFIRGVKAGEFDHFV